MFGLRQALVGALVIPALLTPGCGDDSGGGSSVPEQRPADFQATFKHVDGSVPPPHHVEWTLNVNPDGSGELVYIPDYSGPDVPRYTERVRIDPAGLDRLYGRLRGAGLLDGDLEEGSGADAPTGGGSDSATFRFGGRTVSVPATAAGGSPPIGPFTEDIEALVPADVWNEMKERHADYAREKGYGELP